jgi:hypothetical protein
MVIITPISFMEYIRRLSEYSTFDVEQCMPEPKFNNAHSESCEYISLESLSVGDILKVDGDEKSHPSTKYFVEIIEREKIKRIRLWNQGRGPVCLIGSLECISFYDHRNKTAEFGALKVGANSVWPYFIVHSDGLLQQPLETWSDGVGEILLQKRP